MEIYGYVLLGSFFGIAVIIWVLILMEIEKLSRKRIIRMIDKRIDEHIEEHIRLNEHRRG